MLRALEEANSDLHMILKIYFVFLTIKKVIIINSTFQSLFLRSAVKKIWKILDIFYTHGIGGFFMCLAGSPVSVNSVCEVVSDTS